MARILDGNAAAAEVRAEVAEGVGALRSRSRTARLDVILVGEDPASVTYVRNKQTDCAEVGMETQAHRFRENATQEELEETVERLNEDEAVSGFFIMPCTPHGIVQLLRRNGIPLEGKEAVVLGRSNLVGVATRGDVLVVALGRREMIGAEHVKEGAVVVDVGIHRRDGGGLVGDVRFEEVEPKKLRP